MTREIRANAFETVAVALVVTFGVASCSSDDGGSGAAPGSQIERGAEVYAGSCASCHGVDLRGTDKGPSQLSIDYEPNHHTDDSFRNAIAAGAPQHHWNFGDMGPVEGLTDEDVEAVIAFVRAEQRRQGFER